MALQLSSVAPPPLCRNVQPNGSNLYTGNTDDSPRTIVNSTIQAPTRKFVDEGELRKISGRLFSDSGPRRSTRFSGGSRTSTNANVTAVVRNGTNNFAKNLGSSKLSSVLLRTVTLPKGKSRANENIDDARANMTSVISSAFPSGDVRFLSQDGAIVLIGGVVISDSKVISGVSEVLGLFRTLGEGYRLSCLYTGQDALDTPIEEQQLFQNVTCKIVDSKHEITEPNTFMGPQYVCTNFWTFICMTCSGIHREFTHRVKSVSMSKFTLQEVDALQSGGNQRARDIYIKDWDLQRQRLPDSSNADKIREFIKNVYVDRKYAGGKTHDKPPRDMQSHRNHEDEMRRASSYHSYSQSPPYDYQYEDRRYGKQVAAALSRKPGSDRGHYVGKVSSFVYSPGRLSDQMFEDKFANEGSAPRVSDFDVSSGGDPFPTVAGSPNFLKDVGFASPTFQSQRDVLSVDTHPQMINPSLEPSSQKDAGGISVPQSSDTMNYGGLDLFNTSEASASPPIYLFQLPATSSVSSKDLLQPAAVSSKPPENSYQPPPSIDFFAGVAVQQPATTFDGKKPELPVPKNEGWATFDSPQPAASGPGTKNLLPAVMPSDEDLSVKFDQPSSLNTTVPWPLFDNSSDFGNTSIISSQWQEGHDGQASTFATGTLSWNAFNDFVESLPVEPQVVTYNHLATTEEHLGWAVSENHDNNDGIQTADSHTGFAATTLPSENGTAPLYAISMNPLLGEKRLHAADHKSSNPFDLPYDSELEQNDMFFDMSSLKTTLPNAQLPSPFFNGASQPWLPQNPATPYISAIPQGGLAYMSGHSPSSQLSNVPAQGPVASIGGNPFV